MKKVLIVYSKAGGGHIIGAKRLKKNLENNLGIQTDLLDLYQTIDQNFYVHTYNFFLKTGISGLIWTYLMKTVKTVSGIIKLYEIYTKNILNKLFLEWDKEYDTLVINIPGAPIFLECAFKLNLKMKFVVHILDFDDVKFKEYELCWAPKNNKWINDKTYFISPTEACTKSLLKNGIPLSNIKVVHGFPLALDAILIKKLQKIKEQSSQNNKLPKSINVLIFFGSLGSPEQIKIMKQISKIRQKAIKKFNFTFIFGKNKYLLNKAQKIKDKDNLSEINILGWTTHMLDVFLDNHIILGKPGATSVMEVLTMGKPFFTIHNIHTYPQEIATAEYIKQNEIGIVANNFDNLVKKLYELSEHDFMKFKQNAIEKSNKFLTTDQDVCNFLQELIHS